MINKEIKPWLPN